MTTKRVLIVDDDPDLLFLVAHSVKNLGPDYQVSTASNGASALEQILKQKIDLVVTDYMMPEITGLDLIEKARKLSPQTHFILMTAHHDTSQLRANIDDLNLSGFVGKPFTMPELLKVIQHVTSTLGSGANEEVVDPSLPKADIKKQLQTLRRQAGAHIVLLVNSEGSVVHAVGNTDHARISRLAAFVSANFLAITELSSLFGDTDSVFKSSYYEGNKYNIYAYNINGDYFLAVIFGAGGKPGTVWFYTKQIAADLADVLPTSETTILSHDASVTLAEDFETLVGDENNRENKK